MVLESPCNFQKGLVWKDGGKGREGGGGGAGGGGVKHHVFAGESEMFLRKRWTRRGEGTMDSEPTPSVSGVSGAG